MDRGHDRDIGTGFSTSASLFRELLQHDRETTALVAVLSTRVDQAARDLDYLRGVGEQVALVRQTVAELERWREGRENLASTLQALISQVEALQRGSHVATAEGIKGKWAAIGMAITAGSGVILGLINLIK